MMDAPHSTLGLLLLTARLLLSSDVAAAEEPRPTEPSELVVIVADSVPATEISLSALKRAFTLGKVSLGDVALLPINAAPRSPERVLFDRLVLGMDPDAIGRFWIDQKIRGLALPPKTVPSPALSGKIVAKLSGAITYVPAGRVPTGTHALAIDGKLPGQAGYPLKEE